MTTHRTRGFAALLTLSLLVAAGLTQALPAAAETPEPGRYIVQTTSEPSTDHQVDKMRTAGASVDAQYTEVLQGFAAELDTRQLRKLQADPSVTSIVPDRRISLTDSGGGADKDLRAKGLKASTVQTAVPWGLDRIDQRPTTGDGAYHYGTTGQGVTAFVVDSGIRMTHSDFGGRAVSGYDFVDGDSNASDCAGHGTHVAGTIGGSTYGVAKRVKLVSVRVFDCYGDAWYSDMIAGFEWVVKHKPSGPSVVNFSGGGPADSIVDRAVSNTIKAGIPVVVAAGNDTDDACAASPSRLRSAITVGASDSQDHSSTFTNYGSCVDLFAPGTGVRSDSSTSNTGSAVKSGTSMAAPHVTGAVARYLQGHPFANPSQTAAAIVKDSTPNVLSLDYASPNRMLYVDTRALALAPTRLALRRDDAKKTITVSWAPPTSPGGAPINLYQVLRQGKDAAGVTAYKVNVAATARSYTISKLKAGTAYTITVNAVTPVGAGANASAKISLTALPGKPKIKKPSSGSTKDKLTSITAHWSAPAAGAGPVGRYRVTVTDTKTKVSTTETRSAAARNAKIAKLTKKHTYTV
ncbi:MAG: S8 family serine peptidase, partial [Propionibacteriaceae bacterium]